MNNVDIKTPLVEFRDIHKRYGVGAAAFEALKGVNFRIDEGEFVAIMGPSGSGKSTTMNIIGALDRPTAGEYLFDGVHVEGLSRDQLAMLRRYHLGFVFQGFNLLARTTALENVELPLLYRGLPRAERHEKAMEALERVGLADWSRHTPSELSGGQQQRVAIARALVNEPKVLLLDEPLGALDAKLRKEMQFELKKIQKEVGITFIFVTHDQEEALSMSDTVVVMNNGIIQQIGSPEDIYNEPENRFVANFIGDSNIIEGNMIRDCLVCFDGIEFPCVDKGFKDNEEVEVVLRPEDIDIVEPDKSKLKGKVASIVFKGVHYEIIVRTDRRDYKIHTTDYHEVGKAVGLSFTDEDIHVMYTMEN